MTPAIGQRFDLEETPAAIEAMEAGALTGKTVINVKP